MVDTLIETGSLEENTFFETKKLSGAEVLVGVTVTVAETVSVMVFVAVAVELEVVVAVGE